MFPNWLCNTSPLICCRPISADCSSLWFQERLPQSVSPRAGHKCVLFFLLKVVIAPKQPPGALAPRPPIALGNISPRGKFHSAASCHPVCRRSPGRPRPVLETVEIVTLAANRDKSLSGSPADKVRQISGNFPASERRTDPHPQSNPRNRQFRLTSRQDAPPNWRQAESASVGTT